MPKGLKKEVIYSYHGNSKNLLAEFCLQTEVESMLESSTNVDYVAADRFCRIGTQGWLILAKAYAKEKGNLNVPVKILVYSGKKKFSSLYQWLKSRKKEYREYSKDNTKFKDKLWVFEELSKLDPNWHLDRSNGNDAYTQSMLEESKEYFEANGNLNVFAYILDDSGKEKSNPLYVWLSSRKKEYREYFRDDTKHTGKAWIFDELSKLDPNWHLDRSKGNDAYTQSMLKEVREYFKSHGDLNVARNIFDESGKKKKNLLYDWLLRRKKEYREYLKDGSKNLDKVCIFQELTALDSNWNLERSNGNEVYTHSILEELKEYFKINGDLKVSAYILDDSGKKKENPLYVWLLSRKKEYREYLKDKTKFAHKVWVFEELSSLVPNWYLDSNSLMLEEIKQYVEKQGDLKIPQKLVDDLGKKKGNPLYAWLLSRKLEYREYLKDGTKYQDKVGIFKELAALDQDWYLASAEKKATKQQCVDSEDELAEIETE